jgi:hypothetical protein
MGPKGDDPQLAIVRWRLFGDDRASQGSRRDGRAAGPAERARHADQK